MSRAGKATYTFTILGSSPGPLGPAGLRVLAEREDQLGSEIVRRTIAGAPGRNSAKVKTAPSPRRPLLSGTVHPSRGIRPSVVHRTASQACRPRPARPPPNLRNRI